MQPRAVKLSKYLAKYLRHAPQEIGLTLGPGGWLPVDDLLAAAEKNGFPITYDELVECVETNDKQRFAFDVSGELIRANQGHNVEIDLQLEDREPPETHYHGTVERFLPSILKDGLLRGKQHHVHLSKDMETATKVVGQRRAGTALEQHLSKDMETATKVGARRGKPVMLRVDVGRRHKDGHKFRSSAHGVWLTDSVQLGNM
jgi:putative RNA 2'-phosphotransferase